MNEGVRKERIFGFMATFKTLEEAQEVFKGDRFATVNGMHIDELGEDSCVCSMMLTENHRKNTDEHQDRS